MKIQQHDGVVVDAGVTAAGLRRSTTRGRGVAGEREAPRLQGCGCPPTSPFFIGPLGGGGQGGGVPPRQVEAPPLGFPTLGAWGAQGGAQ